MNLRLIACNWLTPVHTLPFNIVVLSSRCIEHVGKTKATMEKNNTIPTAAVQLRPPQRMSYDFTILLAIQHNMYSLVVHGASLQKMDLCLAVPVRDLSILRHCLLIF